jgi:multiple sugar transport system permease protein
MVGQLRAMGRERWWVLVFMAPMLLGLVLGVAGSIAVVFGLSFFAWDLLTPAHFIGVENYVNLPGERMFVKALGNTVFFAALYVPLTTIFAFGAALLLNRRVVGVSFFRALYFLPVISSPTAIGLVWSWMFANDHGVFNTLLGHVGVAPVNWLGPVMTPYAVVIANVWGAIGEGMIIFLAGLQAIPREHYEIAHIDGAKAWERLFYITLPAMAPSLFFQAVLATINAFQAFDYIYILTRVGNGNSTYPTLVFSIYRSGFRFFRMGEAATQAVVLTSIILVLTLIYFRLQKRWEQPV